MRKLILLALIVGAAGPGCRQQPAGGASPSGQAASPSPGSSSAAQEQSASAAAGRDAGGVPGAQTDGGPRWRDVSIPAGTRLSIRLEQALGSDTSRVEEPVRATVITEVVVGGITVVPAGSAVAGVVTEATRSGRVKGLAQVAVRFDRLDVKGVDEPYAIRTGLVTRQARSTKGKDAAKIGVPAIGGAVLGGIFGGKKGALIGTTVGGGAGTAVVLSTRGQEVRLPRGTHLAVKLLAPVTVRVPDGRT